MQNPFFKNIFGHQIFICKPIFTIFAAHFKTKAIPKNFLVSCAPTRQFQNG